MAFEKNPGLSKLAHVLNERMKKASENELIIDFASIDGNYALKTNTFPVSIPKSDYTICRNISGICLETKLQPGDRVLVAWIGAEVVVIDVIVPASIL